MQSLLFLNRKLIIIKLLMLSIFLIVANFANATDISIKEFTVNTIERINTLDKYPNLEKLNIHCLEELEVLPESIGNLLKLRELNIDNGNGCAMNAQLPSNIGNLKQLRVLNLSGAMNDVEAKPKRANFKLSNSITQLEKLEELDLGQNSLKTIPSQVFKLKKIKKLRLSYNKLEVVPSKIQDLVNLESLALDGMNLYDLPNFLQDMPKLRKVDLGYNCAITQSDVRKKDIVKRFPKITFNFEDKFDCPEIKK